VFLEEDNHLAVVGAKAPKATAHSATHASFFKNQPLKRI
jgi:spore cortex formation protein SpoVR/YcgB (stage V sporulation)